MGIKRDSLLNVNIKPARECVCVCEREIEREIKLRDE